jgi:hypothetical protein
MSTPAFVAALQDAQVQSTVLDAAQRQAIIARLRERLGVDVAARAPWDSPSAPQGRQRHDGWRLVPTQVGAAPCVVLLAGAETMWSLASGSDLLRILTEAPALEFYVCDQDATYLLCSNDHDVVIGWGTASAWVDSLGQNDGP